MTLSSDLPSSVGSWAELLDRANGLYRSLKRNPDQWDIFDFPDLHKPRAVITRDAFPPISPAVCRRYTYSYRFVTQQATDELMRSRHDQTFSTNDLYTLRDAVSIAADIDTGLNASAYQSMAERLTNLIRKQLKKDRR